MDRPGRPTLSGPGTPARAHSRHGQPYYLVIISRVGTLFFLFRISDSTLIRRVRPRNISLKFDQPQTRVSEPGQECFSRRV